MIDRWMHCRIHGKGCDVPWGYDPAHTDTDHPYTLEELAQRTQGPHRYAYPDSASYVEGFYLWRVLTRDAKPTAQENYIRQRGRVEHTAPHLLPLWEKIYNNEEITEECVQTLLNSGLRS